MSEFPKSFISLTKSQEFFKSSLLRVFIKIIAFFFDFFGNKKKFYYEMKPKTQLLVWMSKKNCSQCKCWVIVHLEVELHFSHQYYVMTAAFYIRFIPLVLMMTKVITLLLIKGIKTIIFHIYCTRKSIYWFEALTKNFFLFSPFNIDFRSEFIIVEPWSFL